MSDNYLSTTKPVVQQQQQQTSKPSGGGSNTQQPTGGTQQSQQPSGSGKGDFVPGPGMMDPSKNAPDLSEYEPAGGRELTEEIVEEGWKGIQ